MSIKRSKSIDVLEISGKETFTEKCFRILALITIIVFPFTLLCCFRVVKHYKRAVILRFGRLRKDSPAGPGIIWHIPYTDDVTLIDIRTQTFDLPLLSILTKDSVTISLNAAVYFHVVKPIHCLLNIQYYRSSTELITVAILRNTVAHLTLKDVLEHPESIGVLSRNDITRITMEWGIDIERLEIKDIELPFALQKAMAAEAESSRAAKARIIETEGEVIAAESLSEAAKLMTDTPQVLLLRYLQLLNTITIQQQTTLLYPFPLELPDLKESEESSKKNSEEIQNKSDIGETSKNDDKKDDKKADKNELDNAEKLEKIIQKFKE